MESRLFGERRSPTRFSSCVGARRAHGLLNDLIRPQQRRRDREAERFGGLEVDDELELCGLFDGQIGWLGALENLVDVRRSAPKEIRNVRSIGHQASGHRQTPSWDTLSAAGTWSRPRLSAFAQ